MGISVFIRCKSLNGNYYRDSPYWTLEQDATSLEVVIKRYHEVIAVKALKHEISQGEAGKLLKHYISLYGDRSTVLDTDYYIKKERKTEYGRKNRDTKNRKRARGGYNSVPNRYW